MPHGNLQQAPIQTAPTLISNNIHSSQQPMPHYISCIPPPMVPITPQRLQDALLLLSSMSNFVPRQPLQPPIMQCFPQGLPL
jgi:hypothetical protein